MEIDHDGAAVASHEEEGQRPSEKMERYQHALDGDGELPARVGAAVVPATSSTDRPVAKQPGTGEGLAVRNNARGIVKLRIGSNFECYVFLSSCSPKRR